MSVLRRTGTTDDAQDGRQQLAVVPQVLAEFYAIVTDARRVAQLWCQKDAAARDLWEISLQDRVSASSATSHLPPCSVG